MKTLGITALLVLLAGAWAQVAFREPICDSPEAEEAALAARDYLNGQHTHGYKYELNRIEDIKVYPGVSLRVAVFNSSQGRSKRARHTAVKSVLCLDTGSSFTMQALRRKFTFGFLTPSLWVLTCLIIHFWFCLQMNGNEIYVIEVDLLETNCHVLDPTPLANCTVRPKHLTVRRTF